MRWITFCSQTGTEIMLLSQVIKRIPDSVITNQYQSLSKDFLNWVNVNNVDLITLSPSPSLVDYYTVLRGDELITLHGYLRIIPEEVLRYCPRIYNGHPGLINKYPLLKGKDPQERAYRLGLKIIGSVVHKVTVSIDEGDIVSYATVSLDGECDYSRDDYFNLLRETSILSWKSFFTKHIH